MVQRTLEERVTALEDTVAALVTGRGRQKSDWKSTVGMFEGDAVIAEIQEEGRKIREAERRAARRESES
jgi:O-acetylhomoserine/O-acetylserine sulfhydrylase-like pyridoxal-dependent enzyme